MNWNISIFVAYIGPDTVLPLASALAAMLGVLLMFWNYVIGVIRRFFRAIFRRGGAPPPTVVPTDATAEQDTTPGNQASP